jgi:hypothetical protein
MWLAGWAARREPATRKATELFVKALALEDSTAQRTVIVAADLLAIPRAFALAVASRVQARFQIPRERLLFNASHTHTAPEVRPDKVPFFQVPAEFALKIEPYVQGLEDQFVATISAALQNLRPARLSFHRTKVAFVQNRRSATGPADPEVPVLQVTTPEGQPRAILFGLACHNLVLPPSFCQYHGDFAGLAQQRLQGSFPGATALFLSGAGADQDPAPRGTLELAQQHGQTLATEIDQALARQGQPLAGPLHAAFEEVALDFSPLPSIQALQADLQTNDPPRQRKAAFLLQAISNGQPFDNSYPCPVQVLGFGEDLLLFGLGGEPVVDYALQLRSEFAGPAVWVAGYCNDGFGYLPTRRVLREGGYEGTRSLLWSALPTPFMETTEERVIESCRRLVRAAAPKPTRLRQPKR